MNKKKSHNEQTKTFIETEADEWFHRNKNSLDTKSKNTDPLYNKIKECLKNTEKKHILEVGASNGYRLSWLKDAGAKVTGVDPSKKAVTQGKEKYKFTNKELITNDALSFLTNETHEYDAIIFGHSLYLIPPHEIPLIVAHSIRILKQDGYIFIFDFDSPHQIQPYHHHEGLYSYKAPFDTYFTWLPTMHLVSKNITQHNGSQSIGNPKENCALTVIKKISIKYAYPKLIGKISV